MNVGSLFSGIGGMDLGLQRAGHPHVFFCESDEWRRRVLAHHWPGIPIYEDVAQVAQGSERRGGSLGGNGARADAERDGSPLPIEPAIPDLLCGGFPCQDVSVAGRRAGLAGERSGLFFEFARIVGALRPGWLLVENVPGLLSSNGGRDFGVVVGTLADLGYGVAWRVLDSRFFGVPQRRRRVFIVGALATDDPRAAADRAGQILAVGTRCPMHPATRGETRAEPAVASLSGLGTGGPDDNDGQGGRLVSHALTSEGHGASEDGTGRGTPIIAKSLMSSKTSGWRGNATDEAFIAAPLSHGSNPNSSMASRRREDDVNLVAGPLGGGNDGIGRRSEDDPNLVTAFSWQQGDDSKWTGTGRGRSWVARAGDYAAGMSASGRHDAIAGATHGVRRLTPTECERLQALPDGWTDFGPDSRRYAALGDAVTSSVAEWIGRRIMEAARA